MSGEYKLELAINRANAELEDDLFYSMIEDKESFDMSTASPKYIADMIKRKKDSVHCYVYTYHNRFTRALGYFSPAYPDRIYINTAKLGRSVKSIAGSFIHEYIHLLDANDDVHSFGHGSNNPRGNTAPYWISNLVTDDMNNSENAEIVYKKSFVSRIKSFLLRIF
jgi:hypothetical protein